MASSIHYSNINSITKTFPQHFNKLLMAWVSVFFVGVFGAYYIKLPLVEKFSGVISFQENSFGDHVSDRSGVVTNIQVEVGDVVHTGDVLIVMNSQIITNEEIYNSRRDQLLRKIKLASLSMLQLNNQLENIRLNYDYETNQIESDININNIELASISRELTPLHARRVSQQELLEKGFVRLYDYEALVSEIAGLESRQLVIAEKRNALIQSQIDKTNILEGLVSDYSTRIEQKTIEMQLLEGNLSQFDLEYTWNITAKFDGIISAIGTEVGRHEEGGKTLISIVSESISPEVLIFQPTTKRVSIDEGSEITIAIDAFPTQIYGVFPAKIVKVGKSPSQNASAIMATRSGLPYYVHSAIFTQSSEMPTLEDGYRITANILIRDRTIFQWLLSPFILDRY